MNLRRIKLPGKARLLVLDHVESMIGYLSQEMCIRTYERNQAHRLNIRNECTTDCGENIGASSTSSPAPEVAASDEDGDGDGDPDSEPPHRISKSRSTPPAAASCGTAALGDPLALSVVQFCERHNITKPTFYELVKRGTAPRIMKVGRRTLISIEAAADWRRQMEQGAQLSRRCA